PAIGLGGFARSRPIGLDRPGRLRIGLDRPGRLLVGPGARELVWIVSRHVVPPGVLAGPLEPLASNATELAQGRLNRGSAPAQTLRGAAATRPGAPSRPGRPRAAAASPEMAESRAPGPASRRSSGTAAPRRPAARARTGRA